MTGLESSMFSHITVKVVYLPRTPAISTTEVIEKSVSKGFWSNVNFVAFGLKQDLPVWIIAAGRLSVGIVTVNGLRYLLVHRCVPGIVQFRGLQNAV
ncbi:MAG: hypothetical protein R3E50_15135 [Halioglobus sp.]